MTSDHNPSRNFTLRQVTLKAPPLAAGLYLVSTPIGNLGDITLRALETLAGSDLIACEDTRTSGILLSRYGISKPKTSYNEHNAQQKGLEILRQLEQGKAVSVISDAGTPLVSDPGFRLVKSAVDSGVPVIPVPGASAPVAALSGSGLPNDQFVFGGFLPSKQGARKKRLEQFSHITATIIFFESPKRLAASLKDMASVFGDDRPAVVAREITKMHETFYRDTLSSLAILFEKSGPPKGEIVLLIDVQPSTAFSEEEIDYQLARLLKEMSTKEAANILAKKTGLSKRTLYQRALAVGNSDGEA